MDSNNGINKIQIGEREGRCFSSLVHRRNFGLIHGIGRSGDVTELQPKAVGSSILAKLLSVLMRNFLKTTCSLRFVKDVIILPFATGMAITISILTIKKLNPSAKYVIWCRIDQKTCLKSVITANLEPIVIEPIINGEEIDTNIEEIDKKLIELGLHLIRK